MSLPLEGVRVLAVEQYGAGPYGSLQLASLGAEIIKVETPAAGDVSRNVGPHFAEGGEQSAASFFFQGLNHNKKSIGIDLQSQQGQDVFHSLVKTSDGVISNLRGDVVDRLGLGYDCLKVHSERIVCAHLTAYGRTGERSACPGYDYLMQAQTGYFSLTGDPDSPPARFGLSIVDLQSGVTLALALLAGILSARESGRGRDLDVSLFDVALHNLNYVAMWSLNANHNQQRVPRSAHFSLAPCQLFRTKDGWIYLMCNKEKFWINLCAKLDRGDLIVNSKFVDFPARLENRDQLTEILDEALSKRTTSEWLQEFGNEVPAAQLLSVEQALQQEFVLNSGRILHYANGTGDKIRTVKPPIHTSHEFTPESAPGLGSDTDSLLNELGYSSESISHMRRNNVVL